MQELHCAHRCDFRDVFFTIHEELNFSWIGSCIQGLGQVFDVTSVLQALLLTSAAWTLDAVTYALLVMPLCFAFLSIFFGFPAYACLPRSTAS